MLETVRSLGVVVAAAYLVWALPAGAVEFGCQIGKPTYCMKYAGLFCVKENTLPEAAETCALWEKACLGCHALIGECFAGPRPPTNSPLCTRCTAEWRACMHAIDAKYWPNRLSGAEQ